MSLLKIVTWPNPILELPADPVTNFNGELHAARNGSLRRHSLSRQDDAAQARDRQTQDQEIAKGRRLAFVNMGTHASGVLPFNLNLEKSARRRRAYRQDKSCQQNFVTN